MAAHSLAVLAAGLDYLTDAAAIAVSLLAVWLASRPPTAKRPHGYPRATTVAALVNAGWLLILNVAITVAAIERLVTGTPRVEGLPVLVVSVVAAVAMLTGALILGGGDEDDENDGEDLTMRAVLLDTAADAAAAAGVAASGAIILAVGGAYWLDPSIALAIAVVVGYYTLKLLREIVIALTRGRLSAFTRRGSESRPTAPGTLGRPNCEARRR